MQSKKNKKFISSQSQELLKLASFTEFNPRPVVEVDFKGNIIYTNPSARAAFPDLETKKSKHSYLSGLKNIITLLKKGKKSFSREVKIKDKWFRHFFYYMPEFKSIVIYGLDITHQKEDQEKLKKNEKRYHLLFEKMNYGYALQDIIFNKNKKPIDYRFVDVNPAFEKISKLKKDYILGKTANEISLNAKTKESIKTRKRYNQVTLTGKPLYFESYNEKLKKYFELYVYKPNENQLALIFSDITNRKKTDEEKNNFISIMSHELRNPLTPIMANAQFVKLLLQKEEAINPAIKESIDVIEKQAKIMADLLNDILDVSRLSRHKIQLKKRRIDICDVIKNSIATSMPFINIKNQKLSVFFGQEQIYIQADPLRIEQIVVNIINNASKYTQPNGHIQIHVGIKKDVIQVRVKDNGIGMSAQKISRIFELFSDDSQPFMGIGGLGIGLNIVKNLVSMHKGSIFVTSKGENQGSKFIIEFPLAKNYSATKKPAPLKKETPKIIDKKYSKILIVEDNEHVREAIYNILSQQGHQIKATHSGLTAVKIAKSFKPDVALVDIGLLDISGHKVAKLLKEQYRHEQKNIKLVALTGYGQEKDKKLSKEAGFDYHITKPIDMNDLIKLIEK